MYITRFCLACALIFSSSQIFAQSDSIRTITLSGVVISENRIKNIPLDRVSQNIAVIQKADMDNKAARSMQEVLGYTAGVDVRQRGVAGIQADISIRGGGYEQTLMLLNGIKLSDPQTGHHMVNIPVPFYSMQRIDVLKGPGARIFGQNAFAGAINVMTVVPDSLSLCVQAYGGDFGAWGGTVYASLPAGRLKQTITVSTDRSAGYNYNSDYKMNNALYENRVRLNGRNEIRSLVGYASRDFGANGYYSSRFPDQWEATETWLAALSHTYMADKTYFQTRAYWRQNNDEFRLKRDDPAFYTNTHTSEVAAIECNGSLRSRAGTTGFGVEARSEKIRSSNLGDHSRKTVGIFLEHRIVWARNFDLRAGIYSNYYDEFGFKSFPGAEFGWQAGPRSRLYANIGRSFRIPTYTELYYRDPSNSSNPNLLPEEATSFELGYRYRRENTRAEMAVFTRNTGNMIDYFRPSSDSAWKPMNLAEVRFTGFEMAVSQQFTGGNGSFRISNASLSYAYLNADASTPEGEESRYALTALRHQLIGGLQFSLFGKAELNLNARYIARISFDPYWLLDARINWQLHPKVRLFAEASNISDTEYTEAGFVQMPGRWFRSGLNWQIK